MKGSVGAQASGGVVMAGCGVWRQGLATGDAREDRNARLGDSGGIEFLATKLVPPRCKGLIPRPRLLDMVSPLSGKRLGHDQGAGRVRQDVAGCGLVARTSIERKRRRVADNRS
jgi:hypothetical protein